MSIHKVYYDYLIPKWGKNNVQINCIDTYDIHKHKRC